MGQILGLGITHYPPLSYKGNMTGRIKMLMADPLLPENLRDGLRCAIARFDRSIPGFAGERAWLVGIESRSACPVRIPRDATTRRATGFENLLPAGEGAGYAGGIMSAALDGRLAEIAVKLKGVTAKTKPSSGRYSIRFQVPAEEIGCSS